MHATGTLTLGTAANGDDVVVSVVDAGCGIPAEGQPHVYEAFFRTKSPGGGTGLGVVLEPVRRIVERRPTAR